MTKAATISPCGRYRYTLSRSWDAQGSLLALTLTDFPSTVAALQIVRKIIWICLNPSDADATNDDPTVRKLIGFSSRFDATALVILNLFAYRTPYPVALLEAAAAGTDIIGPENDNHLKYILGAPDVLDGTSQVFFAWGSLPGQLKKLAESRISLVSSLVANPVCLRKTKDSQPWHPLYVPYDVKPIPWNL